MKQKNKMKKYLFLFLIILITSAGNVFSQKWNFKTLKEHFSKVKPANIEGFYELDSDRRYIVGLIWNGSVYEIIYLFGDSEFWTEGTVRGFVKLKDKEYNVKWDGAVKPGTIPLNDLFLKLDSNGFVLLYPNDSPDYFRKITALECEMIYGKYVSPTSLKMIKTNSGVFEIPATINNVLKIYFIMDTGASDVSISPDIVLTLIKAKAISDEDWLEGQYYKFADGSIAKSKRLIIRSLRIGNIEVKDVEASIANSIDAPLLLGQSALSKLGRIQIDFYQHLFTIIK